MIHLSVRVFPLQSESCWKLSDRRKNGLEEHKKNPSGFTAFYCSRRIFRAPGEIRTHGLPLRRRPLYPAELRVQDFEKYKLQRLFCQIIIWQKTIPALYGEDIFFITERSFRTGPLETEGFPFMAYVWYIM